MTVAFQANLGITLDSTPFGSNTTVTGNMPIKRSRENFPVAKAGLLSTRTDNDTGVITITTADPALSNGDRVDVYWDGGCRRGMLVSSHAGAGPWTVTVGTGSGDVGAGDNLPIATTPVTIAKCEAKDFLFAGSDVLAIVATVDAKAVVVFAKADDTEELAYVFVGAGVQFWHNLLGTTNPVAAQAIAKIWISNGSSSITNTIKAGALLT